MKNKRYVVGPYSNDSPSQYTAGNRYHLGIINYLTSCQHAGNSYNDITGTQKDTKAIVSTNITLLLTASCKPQQCSSDEHYIDDWMNQGTHEETKRKPYKHNYFACYR